MTAAPEKPRCASCRRPFAPTRKRKLLCRRQTCRYQHAMSGFNAPLYPYTPRLKGKVR